MSLRKAYKRPSSQVTGKIFCCSFLVRARKFCIVVLNIDGSVIGLGRRGMKANYNLIIKILESDKLAFYSISNTTDEEHYFIKLITFFFIDPYFFINYKRLLDRNRRRHLIFIHLLR